MSRKMLTKLFFFAAIILLLGGWSLNNTTPGLKGGYQSEFINGYYVHQPKDKSFIQYINNREVDKGTYEKLENGAYKINGEIQEFEIEINRDNSFDIIIKKLNDAKLIIMNFIDETPVYFKTEFDDVEEYKALLGD